MSFELEKQDELDLSEYIRLERERGKIENVVQQWMNAATTLHDNVDQTKKSEIVTLRDGMVANLQTILGL